MSENVSYDYLWQTLENEKRTNQLTQIPKTFYTDTITFINSIDQNTREANLRNNAVRLLTELFEIRKQKILVYVAYNKHVPQQIAANEQEFYSRISEISRNNRIELNQSSGGSARKAKSIMDIPEILLPSGNKAGPFKKEQIITMDNETDLKFLVDSSICAYL
ncbi:MAG: hypothetical protein KGH58_00200 [Candidatus Micrarchaeota archaeon]|nr:hypothetical protein [Candidatus Micrarchaeota archaeon]